MLFRSDLTLESSVYSGASYFVEVTFQNGSTKRGLIAVPKLLNSTDLRYFSFNVAVADQPINVDLYRYNVDSYPNIISSSSTTLLHSRTISLPADPLDGIAATVKVGRGWLGESGNVDLSSICFSVNECMKDATVLRWRGSSEAGSITYKSIVKFSNKGNSSALTIQVTRLEDNSQHVVTVLATRFVNDISAPLLSVLNSTKAAADSSYGVKFWIPYELNSQLPFGTFEFVGIVVRATNPDGSTFVDICLKVLLRMQPTTVNLLSVYISPTFYKQASSAYFVVTDASIGPTSQTFGNGASTILNVSLWSESCNMNVMAKIRARQQTDCEWTKWQMNAVRDANNCGHFLLLDLPQVLNPWIGYPSLSDCKFETLPSKPVQINCHKTDNSNPGPVIGCMSLKMQKQL